MQSVKGYMTKLSRWLEWKMKDAKDAVVACINMSRESTTGTTLTMTQAPWTDTDDCTSKFSMELYYTWPRGLRTWRASTSSLFLIMGHFLSTQRKRGFLRVLTQPFQKYPFFDNQRLKNELQVVYCWCLLPQTTRWAAAIIRPVHHFTRVKQSPETDAHHPCLKIIQTYLRNSCGQERLTHLAKMATEMCVLHELKSSGVLFDKVIDHFPSMKERRMAFLYK